MATWIGKKTTLMWERPEIVRRAKAIIDTYDRRVTLRQVYYRLVATNVIENNERSYVKLSEILLIARENGDIPWDAMEDRSRSIETPYVYDSPEDALEVLRRSYDEDRWTNQDMLVAVVVEKSALAGVIQPVCDKWQVPFCAARGYASGSLYAEAADAWEDHNVLYLGDHDPSGKDMVNVWRNKLTGFGVQPAVFNIALTREQIEQYDLPPQPVKGRDTRAGDYIAKHGHGVWELDALPPDVLTDIVETEILKYIDMDKWRERDAEINEARSRIWQTD